MNAEPITSPKPLNPVEKLTYFKLKDQDVRIKKLEE